MICYSWVQGRSQGKGKRAPVSALSNLLCPLLISTNAISTKDYSYFLFFCIILCCFNMLFYNCSVFIYSTVTGCKCEVNLFVIDTRDNLLSPWNMKTNWSLFLIISAYLPLFQSLCVFLRATALCYSAYMLSPVRVCLFIHIRLK